MEEKPNKENKDEIVKLFNGFKDKAREMTSKFFQTYVSNSKKNVKDVTNELKGAVVNLKDSVVHQSSNIQPKKEQVEKEKESAKDELRISGRTISKQLFFGDEESANKFVDVLTREEIDVEELKELTKKGVPFMMRATVWRILLGVVPISENKQIEQKFKLSEEYHNLLLKHYQQNQENEEGDVKLQHQIYIDSVRTHIVGYEHLFSHPFVLDVLNRVLFIWSKENESIGYFQGLNELFAPFVLAYIGEHIDVSTSEGINSLSEELKEGFEIDCFFSLKKLLDLIISKYECTSGLVFAGQMIQEISEILQRNCSKCFFLKVFLFLSFLIIYNRWPLQTLQRGRSGLQCNMLPLGSLPIV